MDCDYFLNRSECETVLSRYKSSAEVQWGNRGDLSSFLIAGGHNILAPTRAFFTALLAISFGAFYNRFVIPFAGLSTRRSGYSLVYKQKECKNMIKQVITRRNLQDSSSVKDDLKYWLSKPPGERVAAVDYLRGQYHGSTTRLQRAARVIQRAQS